LVTPFCSPTKRLYLHCVVFTPRSQRPRLASTAAHQFRFLFRFLHLTVNASMYSKESPHRERAKAAVTPAVNQLQEKLSTESSSELLHEIKFTEFTSPSQSRNQSFPFETHWRDLLRRKHNQGKNKVTKDALLQWFMKSYPCVNRFHSVAQIASSVSPPPSIVALPELETWLAGPSTTPWISGATPVSESGHRSVHRG
jgi:hypothetical protein